MYWVPKEGARYTLIEMLFLGYCIGPRSERLLCEEMPLNLAHRWSCRIGLTDITQNSLVPFKCRASQVMAMQSSNFRPMEVHTVLYRAVNTEA